MLKLTKNNTLLKKFSKIMNIKKLIQKDSKILIQTIDNQWNFILDTDKKSIIKKKIYKLNENNLISYFNISSNLLIININNSFFWFFNKLTFKEINFNFNQYNKIQNYKESIYFLLIKENYKFYFFEKSTLINEKLIKNLNWNLLKNSFFTENFNCYDYILDYKFNFINSKNCLLINNKYFYINSNLNVFLNYDEEKNFVKFFKETNSYIFLLYDNNNFDILEKNDSIYEFSELIYELKNITWFDEFDNYLVFEINFKNYKIYCKFLITEINFGLLKKNDFITYFKELKNYILIQINNDILKILDKNNLKEINFEGLKEDEKITSFCELNKYLIIKICYKYYYIYKKLNMKKLNLFDEYKLITYFKEKKNNLILKINNKKYYYYLDKTNNLVNFYKNKKKCKNYKIIKDNKYFLKFEINKNIFYYNKIPLQSINFLLLI